MTDADVAEFVDGIGQGIYIAEFKKAIVEESKKQKIALNKENSYFNGTMSEAEALVFYLAKFVHQWFPQISADQARSWFVAADVRQESVSVGSICCTARFGPKIYVKQAAPSWLREVSFLL